MVWRGKKFCKGNELFCICVPFSKKKSTDPALAGDCRHNKKIKCASSVPHVDGENPLPY